MKNIERKLIVVYIILPLVILSFSLGSLMLFSDSGNNDINSNLKLSRAFSTLAAKPVSLMSRETSGDLYSEMNSVRDDFIEYNQVYGSRLSINVATGTSATLARMRSYISTTERMHLSSHGVWNSVDGPKLTMYGDYLTADVVEDWSLTGGKCKFIYLSACNSMGHNGILDTDLANELRTRTSILAVIGFKDVANIVGATLLSQSFWGFHVTYTHIGGISTDTSYTNTIERIQWKIAFIRAFSGLTLSIGFGFLVGLATSGIGAAFISALLSSSGFNLVSFFLLLDVIEDTMNDWELIGSNVGGLYWPSNSGGSGGGKPVID